MHRWLGDIVVPVLNLCARYSFEEYAVKARWSGSILHSAEHCAFINGYDFRKKPFAEGKVLLRKALRRTSGGIEYVGHTEGDSAKLFDAICKLSIEGTVSKKLTAPPALLDRAEQYARLALSGHRLSRCECPLSGRSAMTANDPKPTCAPAQDRLQSLASRKMKSSSSDIETKQKIIRGCDGADCELAQTARDA